MSKKVLIVTGEASGELHGAKLVQELLSLKPELKIFGMGGEILKRSGVEVIFDSRKIAVTGITEVFAHLEKIVQAYFRLVRFIKRERPHLIILIDFPDFNLQIARVAKRLGLPVVYYISPQVWAWRKKRIKKIIDRSAKILVIFPFEEELYKKAGGNVQFVGHPLIDDFNFKYENRASALNNFGLSKDKKTILLLPGSRKNEIKFLLEPMLAGVKKVREENPQTQFILIKAESLRGEDLFKDDQLAEAGIKILDEQFIYDGINLCDCAIVCSGTATLQVGYFQKPMVIIYKFSKFSYLLGKLLVHGIKNFGMANLIIGRTIVPELLQDRVKGGEISQIVSEFLTNKEKAKQISEALAEIKTKLGEGGASRKAALACLELL